MKDDYSKKRRDSLREEKLCINGRSHGKATHGDLCWPCRAVHRGLYKTRAEVPRDHESAEVGRNATEVVHVE